MHCFSIYDYKCRCKNILMPASFYSAKKEDLFWELPSFMALSIGDRYVQFFILTEHSSERLENTRFNP